MHTTHLARPAAEALSERIEDDRTRDRGLREAIDKSSRLAEDDLSPNDPAR
jgi:hypothetical protein